MDEVSIDQIKPSPYQPRLYFDLETIKESIKQDGMLVIPLVRKKPDGKTEYELIDGERRWRATKELGWKTIEVQIKDVDDEVARRMVFALNEERQPYTVEEYTKFFRRMYEQMRSVYAVAEAFRKPQATVWIYVNISILPEPLQKAIWTGKIPVGFIKEMEPVFTEARAEVGDITRTFEYSKSPNYQKIVAWLERVYTGEIKGREELREEYVDPYLEMLDKKRVEKAKEDVERVVPKELIEAKEVTLETPEELERTAKSLRREAKRKRAEALTPQQILEKKREKARNALIKGKISLLFWVERAKKMRIDTTEFEKRTERIKAKIVNDPDEAIKEIKQLKADVDKAIETFEEEERKRNIEEEARKRAKEIEDAERRKIEEEAREKARRELIEDTEFIRKLVENEYLKQEPLGVETPLEAINLEDVVMQELGASIPTDKIPRAREIVKEEIRSLQKRLAIFPEKSAKIEPKFEYLRLMEERGVIPYTIWDFQYRDDYAGDKDFHGNCSPQVVEQCIWRFTNERDLVLDPMSGSGTTIDVCKRYNRKCIGYDIKPPPNRTDIVQNDSRKIPLDNEFIDMIFIHPPYWNLTYFTKAEERLPDLSRAKSSAEYSDMLKQVFQECYRTLKHGKFMCVLLGDLIREGKFVPLCTKATEIAEKLGFINYGYAVKLAHGEVSRKKSGVIVAEPVYTRNLKISHDIVMFFKKE